MIVVTQTLDEQVYVPNRGRPAKPDPDHFEEIYAHQGNFKPDGGLWTSTWATAFEEGWPWWLQAEGLARNPKWASAHGYLLTPAECRVITIASGADIDRFMDAYAAPNEELLARAPGLRGSHLEEMIDWRMVAQEADAVRVTHPYSPDVRFNRRTITFYGWDCEATWWARWCFEGEPRRVEVFPHDA